ncbi:MAG TPA: hypothetical protein DD636_03915, partial [Anaerolineaceae bacterium]|nr:hypothetical protein [Anaerolineaceae bacterium]
RVKRDCFALLAMTKNQEQKACERDCFASLAMTKHKARHRELFCEAISILRKIKGRLPRRFVKRLAMMES